MSICMREDDEIDNCAGKADIPTEVVLVTSVQQSFRK